MVSMAIFNFGGKNLHVEVIFHRNSLSDSRCQIVAAEQSNEIQLGMATTTAVALCQPSRRPR